MNVDLTLFIHTVYYHCHTLYVFRITIRLKPIEKPAYPLGLKPQWLAAGLINVKRRGFDVGCIAVGVVGWLHCPSSLFMRFVTRLICVHMRCYALNQFHFSNRHPRRLTSDIVDCVADVVVSTVQLAASCASTKASRFPRPPRLRTGAGRGVQRLAGRGR